MSESTTATGSAPSTAAARAAGTAGTAGAAGATTSPNAATSPDPTEARLYRRLNRRETHSPRSGLAIVLAVIAALALAYLGTEFVLRLLGQRALLATPGDLAKGVTDAPTYPVGALIAGGIVAGIIGIILIVIALTGGRRARHTLPSERTIIVVDNEVIASSLARRASTAALASPDNATVSVSHRTAVVHLTPTSGHPVDRAAVTAAVDEQLASIGAVPSIRSRVTIAEHGKVGA